jgi:hypothetical protein
MILILFQALFFSVELLSRLGNKANPHLLLSVSKKSVSDISGQSSGQVF